MDGVKQPAREYLAGYTVEVLGNDDGAAQSMNGLPATRLQVNANGQESWTIDGDADRVNSQAVSAETAAEGALVPDVCAAGNYPVRWNEYTCQAEAPAADGVSAPFTKATLDFVSSIIFASSLGLGVMLSAAAVLTIEGGIACLASLVAPILQQNPNTVPEMTVVGSILIVGISLNLLGVTKVKVMNYVPAIFLPILLCQFM